MNRFVEPSQPLDVEADQVAGTGVSVAHDERRAHRAQQIHAVSAQDSADGGAVKTHLASDAPDVPAHPAKCQNPLQ